MNRKEFFKTGGRIILLGGLTASVGYLVVNKKVSASCTISSKCNSCGIYSDCVNPEVKTEREKENPKG
jgi:hypothetical protein